MIGPKPNGLAPKLAQLSCLSVEDLKAEWLSVIGGAPPKNARREYLVRAIAHHLQCDVHGGLPKALKRSLLKLAETPRPDSHTPSTPIRSLKAGARIFREWSGALHEVEVTDDGYRYRDQSYKSLSVIARKITGTRWSGPAFFGLKRAPTEVQHGS